MTAEPVALESSRSLYISVFCVSVARDLGVMLPNDDQAPPGKNTRSTNQYAAGGDDEERAGLGHPIARDATPPPDQPERATPRRSDDRQLSDLDAEVEREERPAERLGWQTELA